MVTSTNMNNLLGTNNILQVDGNDTLNSSEASLDDSDDEVIDEQSAEQYEQIPKIYFTNARSIFPKFSDLVEKLIHHRIDVTQISETWHDVTNDDHKHKIDILENKLGFKFYSIARQKFRDDGSLTGGGGAAILVNQKNYSSCLIEDIVVPKKLEVIWVKVFPKFKSDVKVYIFCGLYSKPNSRAKTCLNDHIATNYHLLKMKHETSKVKFFFLGDFNDHKPDLILQLSPQFRQLIHYPTCGQNILDLCITDAHLLYHPPFPEPALLPDYPVSASPSDHLGSIFVPRYLEGVKSTRHYKLVTVRPITQSQMNSIGCLIMNMNWKEVTEVVDVDSKLERFSDTIFDLLNVVAPLKQIKISCDDPAWMNSRIKSLIRTRNREYDRHGKSPK